MTRLPRILGELVVAPAQPAPAPAGASNVPGPTDLARLISRRAEAAELTSPVEGAADVTRLVERRRQIRSTPIPEE